MTGGIVVNHMHCYICQKAMAFDGETKWCSEPCKAAFDAQNKKRRHLQYFLYGAMALTLLLLFLGGRGV